MVCPVIMSITTAVVAAKRRVSKQRDGAQLRKMPNRSAAAATFALTTDVG